MQVITEVFDDLWDELPKLIRDPFLNDQQHAEVTRRIPFIIMDITIRFLVMFLKKVAFSNASQVFSSKGDSIIRLFLQPLAQYLTCRAVDDCCHSFIVVVVIVLLVFLIVLLSVNQARLRSALRVDLVEALQLDDIRRDTIEQVKTGQGAPITEDVIMLGQDLDVSKDTSANLRKLVFQKRPTVTTTSKCWLIE